MNKPKLLVRKQDIRYRRPYLRELLPRDRHQSEGF
jgi:hypothetical protein